MKLLALGSDVPDTPDSAFTEKLLKDEAAAAWKLYQAGVIREMYFRADREDGVLVLECGSREEAEEALSSLPLVRQSLIRFEIIPLRAYPGFERLFAS